MKVKLLVKFLIILTSLSSVSSKSKLDFNLEKFAQKIDINAPVKNFTWSHVNKLLTTVVDSVANANLKVLNTLASKIKISSVCKESLFSLLLDMRSGRRWAVEMIDASGKIPSGILEGTIMDFGSLEECLKIKVNTSAKKDAKEAFRGRFCMVGYKSALLSPMYLKTPEGKSYPEAYGKPPEWAFDILSRARGYLKRTAFWFGTCVPSTCSEDDIWKITKLISMPLGFNVSVSDCQIREPYVWPSYSIGAVSVLGCLVVLCSIGTSVDAVCRWLRRYIENIEDDHTVLRLLKAFSLLTNTEKLFNTNDSKGCLSCFHGLRFLSATWIVLGHTYFYTDTWKYLKYRHLLGFEEQFNGYLPIAVIENFTVPVGSFFFMSGFLLVYTTWRQLEKSNGKLNIFMFFIHKYWRMTPALGLTLALLLAMPIIDSGPIWNSTLKPPLTQCQDMWWANLLFINNWWSTDQYCLIHTWYLAALMQFHILGVVLLVLTFRWPIVGIFLGSLIVIGCTTTTALLIVWNNFPMPAPGLIKDMDIIDDYNSRIYIKPFTHFPTYMIGMVVAYIFLKYKTKKLDLKYQVIGWTLAVASAVSSVYGLYGQGEHIAVRVLYIIGHRIGWSLGVGWLTYACATGIGGIVNRFLSWNAMVSLGQLSYLTYLLHPLVIIYRNASLRERVYYGHTELIFSFLATLVVSLFLAYIGHVSVEAPFGVLEKIVFKRRSKVDFRNTKNEENQISPCTIKNLSP